MANSAEKETKAPAEDSEAPAENSKALHDAAAADDVEEIRRLFANGVDLDAVTLSKYAEDLLDAGTTVMFIACHYGKKRAAEALAELGGDVHKGDAGG